MGDRSGRFPIHHRTASRVNVDQALTILGLGPDATVDEVWGARRRLARTLHPDIGGDDHDMARINRAVDVLVAHLKAPSVSSAIEETSSPTRLRHDGPSTRHVVVERPSFVIDVLPVDAFEWIQLAARVLGEIVDDDPPYAIDVLLDSRPDRWCRLEIVPDAGSSTVSIVAENVDPVEVTDLWVTTINELTSQT